MSVWGREEVIRLTYSLIYSLQNIFIQFKSQNVEEYKLKASLTSLSSSYPVSAFRSNPLLPVHSSEANS